MGQKIDVGKYLGRRTLILGDVNTGKTTLTQMILDALCFEGLGPRIAVIDMAPEIPQALAKKRSLGGIGGTLSPPAAQDVAYLQNRLAPPRLASRSDEEALAKAARNARKIETLFSLFRDLRRDILFINDVSLYLQAGTAEDLMTHVSPAVTIVANGYFGEKLGGGALSDREREQMEALRGYFDRVILLDRQISVKDL